MERKQVIELLMEKGFKPSHRGFNCLVDAVLLYEPKKPFMEIYQEVAVANDTTAYVVCRRLYTTILSSTYEGMTTSAVIATIYHTVK